MNLFLKRNISLVVALGTLSSPLLAVIDQGDERRDPLPTAKRQKNFSGPLRAEENMSTAEENMRTAEILVALSSLNDEISGNQDQETRPAPALKEKSSKTNPKKINWTGLGINLNLNFEENKTFTEFWDSLSPEKRTDLLNHHTYEKFEKSYTNMKYGYQKKNPAALGSSKRIDWKGLGIPLTLEEDRTFTEFWDSLSPEKRTDLLNYYTYKKLERSYINMKYKSQKKDPAASAPSKKIDWTPYKNILEDLRGKQYLEADGYHFYLMENHENEYSALLNIFSENELNESLKVQLSSREEIQKTVSNTLEGNFEKQDTLPAVTLQNSAPKKIRWKKGPYSALAEKCQNFETFWNTLDEEGKKFHLSKLSPENVKKSFTLFKKNNLKRKTQSNKKRINWDYSYPDLMKELSSLNVKYPRERTEYIKENHPDVYKELLDTSGGNSERLTNKLNMYFTNKKKKQD